MSYFNTIKSNLQRHIVFLKSIEVNDNQKLKSHLKKSLDIDKILKVEKPEKLKQFIEYLSQEGRGFGWSFPNSEDESEYENSFWDMYNQIKQMVGGMTLNERLYYFGYLDEFEKIPSMHKSARDEIFAKLFILQNQ